ncbi:MAG: AAA family ATPase [Byssovorax sp.]
MLDISAVSGVPNGRYVLTDHRSPRPFNQVLITGAPASGKTSMLCIIAAVKDAVGPYPGAVMDRRRLIAKGDHQGRVTAIWWISERERDFTGLEEPLQPCNLTIGSDSIQVDTDDRLRRLFAYYAQDAGHGKFEYFPHGRRLTSPGWKGPSLAVSGAATGRLRLAGDPDKYIGLREVLRNLVLAGAARIAQVLDTQGIALRTDVPDPLASYRDAMALLLPDLRLATVEPQDKGALVWFLRRDGARVELDDLSASEQQAVLFASAFVRLGLCRSVILIDTPELFIHPRRQAAFFAGLAQLGEDNQIIAATSSPELLAAVRPEQVIDLDQA